jgi:phosphoribosylformylglycinamidine synthase subunit PurSL
MGVSTPMRDTLEGFNVMAPDALLALSRERGLSLSTPEMLAVQQYFKKQGRPPTEAELETLAQTWSEHCKHKTFRAAVEHVEKDEMGLERKREYKDLLKDTIVKATEDVKRDWCLSVFKDNAGIVTYNGKDGLALKVETHNHPSALEPYGGAGTGLGGVIRDILGAGLGAKPIANTDVFCFGPVGDGPGFKTGSGLSTRRIFHGVVSGVRDYGNRMGIPTVSGAVYFDEDFRDNPLVYCGTLGLIPVDAIHKEVKKGDRIVMLGGRVGRDGVHGATFSSDNLTTGIPASVVQIGNPIVEKKFMDALITARDRRLYRGVTDCGAGGLSSAVGEMGEETGVDVRLDRVPLKYDGLQPWEIWLSESQERMVLAVPPENLKALIDLFASEDVEATDIGEFTGTGRLVVRHKTDVLVDMEMGFLHGGCPKRRMPSTWTMPAVSPFPALPKGKKGAGVQEALLGILAQPTVASKDWIVRQYDHEVQGRTVLKPFVGPKSIGPGDASVMMVRPDTKEGVAIACGLNPHYSRWDSYWMAASVLDESVRNLVAVGARPDRIAILDNFCAGDPTDPKILGEIVRAAQACHDVAKAYGTPFISGKDSFYNQFVDPKTNKKRAIPTTLLVTAMSHVDDIGKLVTMDLKRAGNWLYAVGETKDELGGSRYGLWLSKDDKEARWGQVPRLNAQETWPLYEKLHEAIQQGLISSCHDCSDGGLGAALAEMSLAGGLGFHVELRKAPMSIDLKEEARTDKVLFSESNGRFVVEVAPKARRAFQALFTGLPVAAIGQVREGAKLQAVDMQGKTVAWSLPAVEKAWMGGMTI